MKRSKQIRKERASKAGVTAKKREGEEEEEEEAAYLESHCPKNPSNLDRMELQSRCDPNDPDDPKTIPSRS
ncbi:hypothetical protein CsSME_00044129 [Camellia sinensis var. sinensis]